MPIHTFQPGDILARRIFSDISILWHFGVLVGPDEVVHLGLNGVSLCPFEEFAAGKEVKRALFIRPKDRELTVARARSAIGVGEYKILDNNCEKFAHWCATGEDNCGLQASLAKILLGGRHVGPPTLHQHASQAQRSLARAEHDAKRVALRAQIERQREKRKKELEEIRAKNQEVRRGLTRRSKALR